MEYITIINLNEYIFERSEYITIMNLMNLFY